MEGDESCGRGSPGHELARLKRLGRRRRRRRRAAPHQAPPPLPCVDPPVRMLATRASGGDGRAAGQQRRDHRVGAFFRLSERWNRKMGRQHTCVICCTRSGDRQPTFNKLVSSDVDSSKPQEWAHVHDLPRVNLPWKLTPASDPVLKFSSSKSPVINGLGPYVITRLGP